MLVRPLETGQQAIFDTVAAHPLQTWQWGEFRKQTGVEVERLGFFENGRLAKTLQVTFHPVPIIGGTAGYLPRNWQPDEAQLAAIRDLGKKHGAIFIKLEPNVAVKTTDAVQLEPLRTWLLNHSCAKGRPLFTKYTFQLDLTPSLDELLANCKSKTRYNIRLAERKGVQIYEDSSQQGLDTYLQILNETTNRQGFYAHGPEYFQKMHAQLSPTGMMRIFHAWYQDTVLASWIMFIHNGVLYYPYGASRSIHRDAMASNLLMWKMIEFGKSQSCHLFDMWGSLGPDANKKHKWYGFHKFKAGYGGELLEFVGSYDYILDPLKYKLFTTANYWRWQWLRLKAKFS